MYFYWDEEKNIWLKENRNVSFDEIVTLIVEDEVLDILENKNYPDQKIYVVRINDYCFAVPFEKDKERIFLKTIYPSRALTKKYLR